jgi:NADH dehydrogenase (ubiquinone) 1 alpha subcomplex subunit 5
MKNNKTTTIVGLEVNPNARNDLIALYKKINNHLERLPATSEYRKNTSKFINEKLDILLNNQDVKAIEDKIALGQVFVY